MYKNKCGLIILNNENENIYYNSVAESFFHVSQLSSKKILDLLQIDGDKNIRQNYEIAHRKRDFAIQFEKVSFLKDSWQVFMITELTAYKRQEEKIHVWEKMLDYVQDALYVIDREGKEVFYKNIERFTPTCRKQMVEELMTVFETEQPIVGKYHCYFTNDHRAIHMLSTAIPVKKEGKVIAVILVNNYINRLKKVISRVVDMQNQLLLPKGKENIPRNGTRYTFDDIIGESEQIKLVIEKAQKAALSHVPVLLCGETGTGKEVFAQSIHNNSINCDEPFVAINCAAIPETLLESLLFGTVKGVFTGAENNKGLMEQAGKGTIFLDEINSMGIDLQAKLLRVLQEKKVRRLGGDQEIPICCRIISAMNTDPQELIRKQALREDFFYRIAVVTLQIPPLRGRKEDIFILTKFFLERFEQVYGKKILGISQELREVFLKHLWPGNVRELSHVLEGAINLIENEKVIGLSNMPDYFQCLPSIREAKVRQKGNTDEVEFRQYQHLSLPERLKAIETKMILESIDASNGNITRSAEILGIHRQNLQARMKKLNIRKNFNA
ncbi:sigma 54-interacting transcriptional regulator [Clostridiaceae bacterium 35-E11]